MQQSGEYRIGAPRDEVWRALNDPAILARCIDGCQSMNRVGDSAFEATIKAKVGPVSATFKADLSLIDLDPPNSYTLNASAKGGAAGFGRGVARVKLLDDAGSTVLRYEVEGTVGGKLAQVGQRLIDGAARKMADDFFGTFGNVLAPGASAKVGPSEAPATEPSGRWIIWIIVFAVLALAIVLAS
jgi:carbon monoxide dehydrogenase subunit G